MARSIRVITVSVNQSVWEQFVIMLVMLIVVIRVIEVYYNYKVFG